jgi:hypothetical protein
MALISDEKFRDKRICSVLHEKSRTVATRQPEFRLNAVLIAQKLLAFCCMRKKIASWRCAVMKSFLQSKSARALKHRMYFFMNKKQYPWKISLLSHVLERGTESGLGEIFNCEQDFVPLSSLSQRAISTCNAR